MSYLSNRVEECSMTLGILLFRAHRIPLRAIVTSLSSLELKRLYNCNAFTDFFHCFPFDFYS